ncbi:hypothetical protein N431DRAFT_523054 [Stipitochalara longipes BDJ]|nr:hypothetical protein N431DRAFT_523054 [Stipitochalara longipes BDJ]
MSFNMSTGASYFTNRLKLARSHLEDPESEACACMVKDHEKIMACPYKHKEANITARRDLAAVKNVTEGSAQLLEKFLELRKKELEKFEEEALKAGDEQNNINNQPSEQNNNDNENQIALNIAEEQNDNNDQPAEHNNNDNNDKTARNSASLGLAQSLGAADLYAPGPSGRSNRFYAPKSACPGHGHEIAASKQKSPGLGVRIRLKCQNKELARTPAHDHEVEASNSRSLGLGARIYLKLKDDERVLTPAWNQNTPEPADDLEILDDIAPVDEPAPSIGQRENQLKRKNYKLFDLESAAKRPHLGFCAPPPVHPIRKPFFANKYRYQEEKPTAFLDNSPPEPEEPAKGASNQSPPAIRTAGAMTRKLTAAGAEIVKPVGDNYAPQGGLTKGKGNAKDVTPEPKQQRQPADKKKKLSMYWSDGGITGINGKTDKFKLTKKEIESDYAMIAERRAQEAKWRAKPEELKASAQHHESMEYPHTKTYDRMLARQSTKAAKNEVVKKKAESDPLSKLLTSKNKALKSCAKLNADMMEEYRNNGRTEKFKKLTKAAGEASKHLEMCTEAWRDAFDDVKETHLQDVKLDSAQKDFNKLQKLQQERNERENFIAELKRDLNTKLAAGIKAKALNDEQLVKQAVSQAELAAKILLNFEEKHQEWLDANNEKLNPAPIAGEEKEKESEPRLPVPEISYVRTRFDESSPPLVAQAPVVKIPDRRNRPAEQISKTYKVAAECASLAKDALEAKKKIITTIKELDIISQKIGASPKKPVLSAVPAHLYILERPRDEIRTNAPLQRIPKLRKPSNLRYKLGACLEEKAAAEAATQAAEEARVQAEIEEQQREEAELEARRERKRQFRAEMTESRRKRAMEQAKETVITGFQPHFQDDTLLKEFHLALKQYLDSEEGMRANARRLAVEAAKSQNLPSFRNQREENYFHQAVQEFIDAHNLSEDESESEGTVHGDQDQMKGAPQGDQDEIKGVEHQTG